MTTRSCLAVILAAGEGTRMKSNLPKVLHKIAGLEMVGHVMNTARAAGADALAVVIGSGAEHVRAAVAAFSDGDEIPEAFTQEERLGTAHAVLATRPAIERGYDDVLVMFGDTPLVAPEALSALRARLSGGVDVAIMGFRTDRPNGYGRLIENKGVLAAIREDKDCSEEERRITFCNAGMMAIAGRHAIDLLDSIGNQNAKGEYYLTDIVEVANQKGLSVAAVEASFEDALGINNRAELAEAEAIWQSRRRFQLMLDGVTLIAPETVYLSYDTDIGADTVVEPNVWFGPGVRVGEGAQIHAFCHFEGAVIEAGAEIGPFARLRPQARIMENAKIGNFCEVKKSRIEPGAKVPHLAYIGDAVVGEKANIGAGTITCNYDGFNKHRTEIGAGAFIGTNSSLVAPLTIGAGAYVASGSVVTDDVPDDALVFGRARQATKEGRGREMREKLEAAKKAGK
ncbi:bifunctional UDP-N-acetylglucosamine diphosphorylase/glucosamine-1-phosphate N-acetyltransferase GlmU [Chelativorans sp. YIM 93263]|uniref:bifunctional UDP-N-acetylglucosamine diphosphorylase/glucosamine-1-phosphate N-acetyltransferase GlmU n=1 Tax=Chelativorans sp. YIM 93263 TaxID=2906648 RepID=UPI002377FCB4|nr:bifunctional UDP-N-acetylglucosamine diphosphorylase/glucosamine-1-phosphate N-acetyltransferase GlmU [Chelativorans sp. YIM 93263]